MLLSMTDTGVIDDDEAKAILEDAATAHRNAAGALDGSGEDHRAAAAIIEARSSAATRCAIAEATASVPAPDGTSDGL